MTAISSETLHASCVVIGGRAILIEGLSGTGKSDLALRLIDRGARLVSEDYTMVRRQGGALIAAPPATLAGKMEVRGLGIVDMPFVTDQPVALIVGLGEAVERMPEPADSRIIAGIAVPCCALPSLDASAPIKVELALAKWGLKP